MLNLKRHLKVLRLVLFKILCLIQPEVFRSLSQSLKFYIIQRPSGTLQETVPAVAVFCRISKHSRGFNLEVCHLKKLVHIPNLSIKQSMQISCIAIKRGKSQIIRVPFTPEEIDLLWKNINYGVVDMILIGIYSGWRPQELSISKIADIDLENNTMFGGLKTDAGRNRCVPIHPKIRDLIIKRVDQAKELESDYLFNDSDSQSGMRMTYDKYRSRWNKVMGK